MVLDRFELERSDLGIDVEQGLFAVPHTDRGSVERCLKGGARGIHLILGGWMPAELFDDLAANVEGARRVGMQTIHHQNFDQTRQELTRLRVTPL